MSRWFVHFAAPSPDEAHDVVAQLGHVVVDRERPAVALYLSESPRGVYGSAEIEPPEEP